MSRCPLCVSPDADDKSVLETVIELHPEGEYNPETEHIDAVRTKRALEKRFDVTLTVHQTKQHLGKAAQRAGARGGVL